MNANDQRTVLQQIARQAMINRGLLPDFSPGVLAELRRIQGPAKPGHHEDVRDERHHLWCSIDNDDSRDLDQLTVAEQERGGVRVLVAVADVDSSVHQGSEIDGHARHNTTSVYTAAQIFSMLPEQLSTGFTSLNMDEDRLAMVVEMVVTPDGAVEDGEIYRALVRNHAKLAYRSVAAWLEGGAVPPAMAAVPGLAENLRLQDRVARAMDDFRHLQGALSLETIEARPVFDGDQLRELARDEKDRAKEIIENFMIGANGVVARFLAAHGYPSIRRVVRTPKRWDRIVQLARGEGTVLPDEPDARALETFLVKARHEDPISFPDLSLAIVKLLGSGEYVAEMPDESTEGHFGLAVKDYGHATAPNRRFTDLITQRLLKAALADGRPPYRPDELIDLAEHCTEAEDAANKVERQVGKSAAALLLNGRIGEQFDAIVTGAASKGTWARLLRMPVEGRVVRGYEGLDVGDRVRVRLVSTDVEQGFIDFEALGYASRRRD